MRFFPEFRRLHDAVVAGDVGQPAMARMSRASSFPHGIGDWHNRLVQSGGVVLDMGIHDLGGTSSIITHTGGGGIPALNRDSVHKGTGCLGRRIGRVEGLRSPERQGSNHLMEIAPMMEAWMMTRGASASDFLPSQQP